MQAHALFASSQTVFIKPGASSTPSVVYDLEGLSLHVREDESHFGRTVLAVDIDLPAAHVAAVILFFETKQFFCTLTEETLVDVVDAVRQQKPRSVTFRRVQWTQAFINRLATAWPDDVRIFTDTGSQEFNRVFGDARLLVDKPWPDHSTALVPAHCTLRAQVPKLVRKGRITTVETRVCVKDHEFFLRRARCVLVGHLIQAVNDRLNVWGWSSMHRPSRRYSLELHVAGEALEYGRTLEEYGIDDETPVEV